jgi:hypothetical protein
MLANVMARLPFDQSPAVMVNAFSVITSVLTLILVYFSVIRLTRSLIGGLAAAVALGTATTFWAQSTTANIRSMTAFFAALAIYLLIRFWQEKGQRAGAAVDSEESEVASGFMSSKLLWLLAGITLVLALGITHHTSLTFMGLVFGVFVLLVDRSWLGEPRVWLLLLLAVFAGLLPLLYLPFRAAAGAVGAPEDLATVKGFLNHVLALGFRGDFLYFTEPGILWERLKVVANIMTFQFNSLVLIAMGIGFLLLLWRDRMLAFLFGGSYLVMVLITAMYRAPQSVEYLMPAYVPLAIMLGYAVGFAHNSLRSLSDEGSRAPGIAAFVSIAMGILIFGVLVQGVDRTTSFVYLHESNRTREFTEKLLDEAPDSSTLLADWHWATPLAYLQEVEGKRTDVEVEFVYPTAEPYGQTWARRIQEELSAGRSVVATHFDQEAYADLPVPDPIDDAFVYGMEPVTELPDEFKKLDIRFGESIEILGYSTGSDTVETGQEALLTLAWRPEGIWDQGNSMFTHLVGKDGEIYAQQDIPAVPKDEGLTITQFRLTPRPGAQPGEYTLMIGAYGSEPLMDADGEPRTPIGSLNVTASSVPVVTVNPANKPSAETESGQTLVGYDWDNSIPGVPRLYLHWMDSGGYYSESFDVPDGTVELGSFIGPWGVELEGRELRNDEQQLYIPFGQGIVWNGRRFEDDGPDPGEELSLPQHFRSGYPVDRDLVVSVRLVGFEDDGFHWAWWDLDDGVPAMGAIPTLKWIGGSAVRDPHWLTVDEDAPDGQVISPLLRLYDAFTGREVPLLDERVSQETPWLPLGAAKVAE